MRNGFASFRFEKFALRRTVPKRNSESTSETRTNNQILALIMQLNQSNVEITPFLQFPVESKG